MQKKILVIICLSICFGVSAMAQEQSANEPKGKAIVQMFGDFHSGFGSESHVRGFALDRAYLGYQYALGDGLSVKGVLDMGAKTDGYDRVAYLKNALVCWKKGNWTLQGGLIPTTQFQLAERHWGHRYLYKSFQDAYKFGASADLGISVAWKATEWLSLDAIVVNGEGYKRVQVGNGMLYGLGATLKPLKGLTLRAYMGLNEQPGATNIMNYAAFAGYRNEAFSVGAEYNEAQHFGGVRGHDKAGISLYGAVAVGKRVELLARYDNLFSTAGYTADDEEVLIAGAQFALGKYVKVAPNFRMALPKDGSGRRYAGYVSCYFGL